VAESETEPDAPLNPAEEPPSEPAPRRPDSALELSGRRELAALVESISGESASPEQLGPYQVSKRLGRGAFGVVYLGHDPELQRSVALKLLRDSASPDATRRLRKEAQAMAALQHPALLTIYGLGEFEGRIYIAMEYAEQGTLRNWLDAEVRRTSAIVRHIVRAARGLHAAHVAGFVHRDVKPSNILIGSDGGARVSDFGLVYAQAGARTGAEPSAPSPDGEPRLEGEDPRGSATEYEGGGVNAETVLGGTPPFMAPELFDHSTPSARSDEFALSVTLFEALFNRRPKRSEVLAGGVDVPLVRKASNEPVPSWLRAVLIRGLAADPNERFGTLDAMARALERGLLRGRRRLRIGAGVATLAVAGGLGWFARSADMAVCTDSKSGLAGVWDKARSATVRATIESSGLSFADSTWETVSSELDAYAQSWAQVHRDVCTASAVRHELSPQLLDKAMACLAGRRRVLAAFVEVLARGDAEAIVAAPLEVVRLPTVESCGEIERLVDLVDAPPAADAAEVEVLSTAVAHANALRKAASYADAGRSLETIQERAASVSYPPLQQDLAYARAGLASALVQSELETSLLLETYAGATRSGRVELATDAARQLAGALAWAGEHEAGERWVRLAHAISPASPSPAAAAGLADSRGDVSLHSGKWREAIEAYREVVDILEGAFGPEDIRIIFAVRDLGNALSNLGQYDEARAQYERALSLAQKRFGPRHPKTATIVVSLASLACDMGDGERCEQLGTEALSIEQEVFGPDHPSVADDLTLVANAKATRGNIQEALALYERADAIYAGASSTQSDSIRMAALDGLSGVTLTLGDLEAAAGHAEHSVEIAKASLPQGHPRIAWSLANLAGIRGQQGQFDQMLALAEEANAIVLRRLGPEHPSRGDMLSVQAAALMYLERYAAAVSASKRQLAIIEAQPVTPSSARAQPLYNIAFSQAQLGEVDAAEASYRASLAAIDPGDAPMSVYPLVGLGRLFVASGRAALAIPFLEQALPLATEQAKLRADAQAALAQALVLTEGDRDRARTLADAAASGFTTLGGAATAAADVLAEFRRVHKL